MSSAILLEFSEIKDSDEKIVGGKAFVLAQLLQCGFDIPNGCVITRSPVSEQDWLTVENWWKDQKNIPLAVRSSAIGEDSSSLSFAGQQKSFLRITDFQALKVAIQNCYNSVFGEASLAYRSHFEFKSGPTEIKMNVILQRMIDPAFSGVFFSRDPRNVDSLKLLETKTQTPLQDWILEVVDGLGEGLVSSRRTPMRLSPLQMETDASIKNHWARQSTQMVALAGEQVKSSLNYEIDMEWSVDSEGKLWILQARPITATADSVARNQLIRSELRRLQARFTPDHLWDGQAFSEWTGVPSPFSLALWQKAFRADSALGLALDQLGYLGSRAKEFCQLSLVDQIFGRPYINLTQLEALLFGPSAYITVPEPNPHLKFDWHRVNLKTVLNAPFAALRMVQVAWNFQTKRSLWLDECVEEFRKKHEIKCHGPKSYQDIKTDDLILSLNTQVHHFSTNLLKWPLILIFLIETTQQSLLQILLSSKKLAGPKEAAQELQKWMTQHLHTLTREMDEGYLLACQNPQLRNSFLDRFGHRCGGELDLANKRWIELGDLAFKSGLLSASQPESKSSRPETSPDFKAFGSIYGEMLASEWELFVKMLQLREEWKNELMKAYAEIRWLALELGKRFQGEGEIDENVFYLKPVELIALAKQRRISKQFKRLVYRRRQKKRLLRSVSLPSVFSLHDLGLIISGENDSKRKQGQDEAVLEGDPLSPGLSFGEVRLVTDPLKVDLGAWPENTILVTEATDPGWTPLFLKTKGIIVEKGGALSHCAILARELGLPLVSGVQNCMSKFKEGEHVWLDGTHGRITRNPGR